MESLYTHIFRLHASKNNLVFWDEEGFLKSIYGGWLSDLINMEKILKKKLMCG